jgi:hypothetical protein
VIRLALADQLGVLGGVRVPLPDPERDAVAFADRVARTLVVGVGVREGVSRKPAILEFRTIRRVA